MLLTGCSVTKTSKTGSVRPVSGIAIEEVRKRNLSETDFNIQKAEVEATIKGNKIKFIASIKYKVPEQWLISLKSSTGIEAARVFITSDTVLINDKFHKKLYFGNSRTVTEKYGIPLAGLSVLLGDLIENEKVKENSEQCRKGIYELTIEFQEIEIRYIIGCREHKVLQATISDGNSDEVKIVFSKMKAVYQRTYPEEIHIRESKNDLGLNIKIRRINFDKIEKLNFIPGKGYEQILIK